MLASLSRFFIKHGRFLSFGLLTAWASSFGQTFFIGFFSADLREAFHLSHTGFGALYAGATFASGASLLWFGRYLDRLDLRLFTLLAALALAVAGLFLATAQTVAILALALFGLRLCGQGFMSHIAVTGMARYFGRERGRAVAVASLGFPLGEAIFPLILVILLTYLDWRDSWLLLSLAFGILLLPAMLWLLRGHGARHNEFLAREEARAPGTHPTQWRQRDLLQEPRFYLLMSGLLAVPFTITAVFFYQVPLAAEKGWEATLPAAALGAYALARVPGSLAGGFLVDRFGSAPLLPLTLLPLLLGVALLGLLDHPAILWIFMALAGASIGIRGIISGTVWAELYGVLNLGAIRSLAQACTVLSTAISPLLVGFLVDAGWPISQVLTLATLPLALILLPLTVFGFRPQALVAKENRA